MTETERYAEADAMADYGRRFAPIHSSIPDLRSPARFVPNITLPTARANANLIDAFAALPVDRLIDETRDLQARMLGADFGVRDFALVAAIIQRLQSSPKLVGALWLDDLRVSA